MTLDLNFSFSNKDILEYITGKSDCLCWKSCFVDINNIKFQQFLLRQLKEQTQKPENLLRELFKLVKEILKFCVRSGFVEVPCHSRNSLCMFQYNSRKLMKLFQIKKSFLETLITYIKSRSLKKKCVLTLRFNETSFFAHTLHKKSKENS